MTRVTAGLFPNLAEKLAALTELALDLGWSWSHGNDRYRTLSEGAGLAHGLRLVQHQRQE